MDSPAVRDTDKVCDRGSTDKALVSFALFPLIFGGAASGRRTATVFGLDAPDSAMRGPEKGNQSLGGESIPQTLPGSSNSMAVRPRPPRSTGRCVHFTRPRLETGSEFSDSPFSSRITKALGSTSNFDSYMQPWQFTVTVDTSSW